MQEQTAISQRRACGLVGLSRSVLSYRSKKRRCDAQLQGRLRDLAAERKRFGRNWNRRIIANWKSWPWRPDSNK
jgi:hypothetical protein